MFNRKFNVFEKILLPVGVGLTFFGFYVILLADRVNSELGWLRLTTVFLWLLLLFSVMTAASSEDMKEELSIIQKEHVTEIKIMREIVHDQLAEIKLLRDEFKRHRK